MLALDGQAGYEEDLSVLPDRSMDLASPLAFRDSKNYKFRGDGGQ